jgi:ABC-type multidrug transport system ATPase subunit
LILRENSASSSSVIVVRDLVQRFKKRKEKSLSRRIYTAVDHLNFHVAKKSCFGLLGTHDFLPYLLLILMVLGANGAGKTTTFRMLINDLKPTSGEIFINRRNIHKKVSV